VKVAQKKTPGAGGKKAAKPGEAAAPPKETKAPPAKPSAGPNAQMSSLVSKFLELADAGVGLGINVISLLNTLARSQAAGAAPAEQQPQGDGRPPAPPEDASRAEAPRNYCIVNRRPIQSGSAVQVSFSINNDLPDAAKKLRVTARGFVGAAHGFSFDGAGFSVNPSEKLIDAMDFERFVLTGSIPADAPEDSYNGWIVVDGDEQMRIPVVLLVSGNQ
jgi:hypothetical protein